MESEIHRLTAEIARETVLLNRLRETMAGVIIGQQQLIDGLLIALLCDNHVLIEGVPGLAKTLTVTTLARAVGTGFQRIQFTPDLLPGDLIGTLIYNPKSGDFTVRKGPLFSNIILADEINRAPAKVQSALLEAMQERQVTIGDASYKLDEPFMVLATQNPIEQEGTYPLPEAQVDRFMLKLKIFYPDKEEERFILRRMARSRQNFSIEPVLGREDIFRLRTLSDAVYLDEKIEEYVVNLVQATRTELNPLPQIAQMIRHGASPRASIFLAMAARANALLNGRAYVTPQDVKSCATDVLRHRVILSYEAEAEGKSPEDIIALILGHVPVP